MPRIDADAHVIETPRTWSYMRDEEQEFRPQIFVRDPNDGAPYRSNQRNEYWRIGEHFQTKTNVSDDLPEDVRDMENIAGRLRHMDETGVDVQVLYPTLFLRPTTTEHDREYAIVRSYNRWLADIWKRSGDRLRWMVLPPLYSLVDPAKVRAELEFGKANGACGIFMRGFECERFANDRYFFPLYEMAQELDLPICFHAGNNSFANHDSYLRDLGIMIFKFPVMGAFLYLLGDEIPKRFPGRALGVRRGERAMGALHAGRSADAACGQGGAGLRRPSGEEQLLHHHAEDRRPRLAPGGDRRPASGDRHGLRPQGCRRGDRGPEAPRERGRHSGGSRRGVSSRTTRVSSTGLPDGGPVTVTLSRVTRCMRRNGSRSPEKQQEPCRCDSPGFAGSRRGAEEVS